MRPETLLARGLDGDRPVGRGPRSWRGHPAYRRRSQDEHVGAKCEGRGDRRQDRARHVRQAVHLSRRYGRSLAPRRNFHRQRDRRGLKPAWLPLKCAFRRMTRMERAMRSGFFVRRRALLAACAVGLLGGGVPLTFQASADPSPIKIAVFDFELDDFSGGAGIAGDKAADLAQLDRATSEVRRLIVQSGRYDLVDVASAEGDGVKSRSLRQCNGCEAAIALKLGADQSFVGVVTRISRTEYTVRFQVRDARTGAPVIARQSDLRIGADYSWNRGAASLIKSSLLDNR